MTGRKSNKATKKRAQKQTVQNLPPEDSPPTNIKREQPPQPQIVKKILKAENDEANTLKTVFKSNPDSQMKDFIRKAVVKPPQVTIKMLQKTPADSHPPVVAQELLDTDDDVADNLTRLFKTSKSYKNM